jgi:hypothetical protein
VVQIDLVIAGLRIVEDESIQSLDDWELSELVRQADSFVDRQQV